MIILAIICLNLMFLRSCTYKARLYGTWCGDGSFDMMEVEAPYEFATELTFKSDDTLIIKHGDTVGTYRYAITDDTLTIDAGPISWGMLYQVSGGVLTINTGGNTDAVFERVRW